MPESDAGPGRFLVTTSWDDGSPWDLKTADLLAEYGLTGTFYVPRSISGRAVLDGPSLRQLATAFEIGAHTLSHVDLTSLCPSDTMAEIAEGKAFLESTVGRDVTVFCYPLGRYSRSVVEAVRRAGFTGARTASWYWTDWPRDPFTMHPTLHAFPHRALTNLCHLARRHPLVPSVWRRGVPVAFARWPDAALRLLDVAARSDGIWHLWGHSWEIEALGLWGELRSVLRAVAEHPRARPVTNGQIADATRMAQTAKGRSSHLSPRCRVAADGVEDGVPPPAGP